WSPQQLVLEVTEGSLLDDAIAVERLHELRELGVLIAIDDFGTGYTSINYLQQLPADILKIDRSFVSGDALAPSERLAFLEAIVGLAESLNLRSIAEGVAEPEQPAELRAARSALRRPRADDPWTWSESNSAGSVWESSAVSLSLSGAWRGRVTPTDSDLDAGFDIDPKTFRRFSQVDDVFSRSFWDDRIRDDKTDTFYATYRRPLEQWRKARGFRRRDYALRNAAWHVADIFAELREDEDRRDGFLDPLSVLRDASDEKAEVGDPETASRDLEQVAKVLGADLVGITGYDDRWIYTERYSRINGGAKENDLGEGLTNVVVIGQAMDPGLISTAPSALAGAATGLGYSQDALVLLAVAQYIRNLGYQAVPSMNDTALAIPFAIKAGLGEYGRHGLVITPEFGPNVRFGKIFTDMPLQNDRPIRLGVTEMCNLCRRCTEACPASAIPGDRPSGETHNQSNLAGVTKWSVDGEACFGYWSKINSDCSVCIRVCPYTRDYSKLYNRLWARLAGSRLRRLALWIDDHRSGGARTSASDWWQSSDDTPVEIAPKPRPG
ncbi:MAG: EAL domain-containing protein, partial [Actinomycetota bacterium]|nr:EAL domain-containing protein [Actinomycetota bacterium]